MELDVFKGLPSNEKSNNKNNSRSTLILTWTGLVVFPNDNDLLGISRQNKFEAIIFEEIPF
jgi:hypothetical protein